MIKVGVVGCGAIAQLVHLPLLRDSRRAVAAAVCDLNPRQAELIGRRFCIPKICPNWQQLVADDSLDAVLVCSSSDSHGPITIGALEHGKHVLVEKPMAMSLEDAEAMARTAEARGRVLMVGYMWRYDPGCEKAIELFRQGCVGKPFLAIVQSEEGGDAWAAGTLDKLIRAEGPPMEETLRRSSFVSSGLDHQHFTVLSDIGAHLLDLLSAFVGAPTAVSYAEALKENPDPHVWTSMAFLAGLRYPELHASFSSSLFMGDIFDKRIRILGSQGSLDLSLTPSLQMPRFGCGKR
jgi:predicted dehydrogenase